MVQGGPDGGWTECGGRHFEDGKTDPGEVSSLLLERSPSVTTQGPRTPHSTFTVIIVKSRST